MHAIFLLPFRTPFCPTEVKAAGGSGHTGGVIHLCNLLVLVSEEEQVIFFHYEGREDSKQQRIRRRA